MPQPSPKQPFMREKTMWIVIVLLALALLLVIFMQMEQGRHIRRMYRGGMPPARIMDGLLNQMPRTSSTPANNQMGMPGDRAPIFVSETGRLALGSPVSPDGQWMMQLIETGAPESTIEHRLILKGLKGQPSRVLVTQSETAKTTKREEPGTHRWHLAGWSKDGKNVYVASEEVYGYGMDGSPVTTYGKELWEVAVDTAVMKKIYTAPKVDSLYGNGFVDVSAVQNQLLTLTNGKIFLSDLRGASRREVKVSLPTKQDEWRRFILNAAGTHIGMLYERFPVDGNRALMKTELGATSLETRLGLFNLKTGKYQDLGLVNGGDVAWKDEKTLTIVGRNGQSEQREVQLP